MTKQSNNIQPVDFIFIYIGGAFIAGWLQQILRGLFPSLGSTTAGSLLSGLWLQDVLMLAVLAYFLAARKTSWRMIGVRAPQGRHPYLGAAIGGILLYVLMTLLVQLINALLPNGLAAQNVQSYMQADDALWVKIFVVLTMGVFVPIAEELIFRGYLFNSLCRYLTPQMAMLFTAVIFGCAHMDAQRAIPLAVGGYLLNVIAVRYQSVFASAIAHGLWNAVMIVAYYSVL